MLGQKNANKEFLLSRVSERIASCKFCLDVSGYRGCLERSSLLIVFTEKSS